MQLRYLRTFVAVASTLNFTRAAEKVHLVQSSVTEQIQALEADLGAALFDRSHRKLQLTEAGRQLLIYAEELLSLASDARAAVASAANVMKGTLTVGGLETLCARSLPPLLTTFRDAHPAVQLVLQVGSSGDLRSRVKSGEMDVSFAFGEPPNEPDLQSECIAQDELVIAVPAEHRLAARTTVQVGDLATEPFMVTQEGCVYRSMFESAFPLRSSGRPPLAGEFGSMGAILSLVASGAGCALVPRLAALEVDKRIAILPWIGDRASVRIHMIWRQRHVQPPILLHFLEAARKHFRASDQAMSALDMQHRPRDETVAHEEADPVGDIVHMPDAANR
jgi:DNA-binding transcriptional LysR family regulator